LPLDIRHILATQTVSLSSILRWFRA
jgi:hypothetical protein